MEPIIPFDMQRLFLGTAPPLFYLEILFRVVVIWLWSILLMRWIGGRSISQLSLVEFILVIALGAAVGDATFYPDVPLLHAMLVVAALVLLDKAVDHLVRRVKGAKTLIDGQPVLLLRDGVILCQGMAAKELGTPELMQRLRLHGVENLGSLRWVWLEPSGQLSVFAAAEPRHGLRIAPPPEAGATTHAPGLEEIGHSLTSCCMTCGAVGPRGAAGACGQCGGREFTAAEPAPKWSR